MIEKFGKQAKKNLVQAIKRYAKKYGVTEKEIQLSFHIDMVAVPEEIRAQMQVPVDQEAFMPQTNFKIRKQYKVVEEVDVYTLMGVPIIPFLNKPVSTTEGAIVRVVIGNALASFANELQIDPKKISFLVLLKNNDHEEISICLYNDNAFVKFVLLSDIVNEKYLNPGSAAQDDD